jgi:adenosine deaminase CECR1
MFGRAGIEMKQVMQSRRAVMLWLAVAATLAVVGVSIYKSRRAAPSWKGPKALLSDEDYETRRKKLLVDMYTHSFSADTVLSAAETNVDNFLGAIRSNAIADYKASGAFPPAQHFFNVRTNIEQSPLFPIFKRMPKGGLLHVHESAAGRCEFVLTNISRRSDCQIYWSTNLDDAQLGTLEFSPAVPKNDGRTGYFASNELRDRLRQEGVDLDSQLRRRYMLDGSDLNLPDVWLAFGNWWVLLPTLVQYRPVFRDFIRDAFKTMHEDGISHVELRVMAPVGTMFDYTAQGLLNTNYTEEDTVREYVAARDYVRANFNTNFSLKLILTGYRAVAQLDPDPVLDRVRRYRKSFPGLIAGADWVGSEDGGQPTSVMVPKLRVVAGRNERHEHEAIHFYFHDGETAWPGNENLIDAVLLGTKRIGHGFNLFQLPTLEHMVRERHIAIEVCPISNQLLNLLPDLRTHPAVGYMNRGVPCVLGSDDPAIMGNDGLTYDFWEAYFAWGLDLSDLKQLAENSLTYSALEVEELLAARDRWHKQWDAWIQWVLTQAAQP